MNALKLVLVLSIVCSFFVSSIHCWGTEGHQVVADIATAYLKTSTANAIQKYLPSGGSLVSVSTLADTYRSTNEGKWSAPLHYVDMENGQTSVDVTRNCASGCVVTAIQNYTARLNGSKIEFPKIQNGPYRVPKEWEGIVLPDLAAEPNALEFLVHFIGDIHCPMHTGWASDQGGNLVNVKWYNTSTNLHSVWDSSIISKYNSNYQALSKELQNMIVANPAYLDFIKIMDPLAWADEGFDLVRVGGIYTFYSDTNPPTLSDQYYNKNLPVVQARLIAGGLRLAALLNLLLG